MKGTLRNSWCMYDNAYVGLDNKTYTFIDDAVNEDTGAVLSVMKREDGVVIHVSCDDAINYKRIK